MLLSDSKCSQHCNELMMQSDCHLGLVNGIEQLRCVPGWLGVMDSEVLLRLSVASGIMEIESWNQRAEIGSTSKFGGSK